METMSNPYAPDEPHPTIVVEEAWLQGALLSNIAYGVELTLFAMCFYLLVRGGSATNRRRTIGFLVLITSLFVMGTLFMAANALFTQLAFVQDRNYPGGPSAYEMDMMWRNFNEVGDVCFVLSNWLMDLLMVWRCIVIYKGCGSSARAITIILSLLFVMSLALSTLYLVGTAASAPFGIDFALAALSATLALNIIVTLLIVVRLLLQRHQMARDLGPGHGSPYTSIIAMIVESAALYSTFALLFILTFALNSPAMPVFMQSTGQVQAASSFLIIFRVAQGKAWTENTVIRVSGPVQDPSSSEKISRLIFAPPMSTPSYGQQSNVSLETASYDAESERENTPKEQFREGADQSV